MTIKPEGLFVAPLIDHAIIYRERVGPGTVRIAFLDMDGPMNCVGTAPNGVKPHHPGIAIEWVVGVDRRLTVKLNRILDQSAAYVVIISSWRNSHGMEQTEDTLRRAGFTGTIIGCTTNIGNTKRPEEIQNFIDVWAADPSLPAITAYTILDDQDGMGHLTHKLIQIDPMNGMNDKDVDLAISMLRVDRQ